MPDILPTPTSGDVLVGSNGRWVSADPDGLLVLDSAAAAVADIADPSTATAEDVANKVNALLGSLRDAGMLAE